jgi:type IV secretion system protein VirB10
MSNEHPSSPSSPSHDEINAESFNHGNTIAPLEGEAGIPSVTRPPTLNVSRKGVIAVALFALMMIAITSITVSRAFSSRRDEDAVSKRMGDRPAAAAGDARRLDMTLPLPASVSPAHVIPAIIPTPEELRGDPIAVRSTRPTPISPDDAPVLLVTSRPLQVAAASGPLSDDALSNLGMPISSSGLDGTRRSLEAYQRQLQGMLTSLSTGEGLPNNSAPNVPSTAAAAQPLGLFGGELKKSATPHVAASFLGNRSLILPKGTAFTCALKTKLISADSGFVGCQVQRNVYSDDGRVLLIERGSHMDGEYRIASVRPGTVRIPVLWTRIRTPLGVTVDIDSPGTGALGESGVDGHVDNRWPERIGAAMLLSLIDDSVKLAIEDKSSDGTGNPVVLPSTTSETSKLAEKVLDSTINIPPLIYQNQGGIVGIYVARDVDFSSVYELKAGER